MLDYTRKPNDPSSLSQRALGFGEGKVGWTTFFPLWLMIGQLCYRNSASVYKYHLLPNQISFYSQSRLTAAATCGYSPDA